MTGIHAFNKAINYIIFFVYQKALIPAFITSFSNKELSL